MERKVSDILHDQYIKIKGNKMRKETKAKQGEERIKEGM